MFICFPWKFTIRHLFPESPALGDLCTKSHIINRMVCFPLTWSCQIEVVQLLSWGKTGSCFSAPDWGLQSERKLMEVWHFLVSCKPFLRTYFVHNINHLFLPCIMREAFCLLPQAARWALPGHQQASWQDQEWWCRQLFSVPISRADTELLFTCLWN